MPPVVVLAGGAWALSVMSGSAQAPSQGAEGAVPASTYVVSAPGPESISVAAGSPYAYTDYWRYYATGN